MHYLQQRKCFFLPLGLSEARAASKNFPACNAQKLILKNWSILDKLCFMIASVFLLFLTCKHILWVMSISFYRSCQLVKCWQNRSVTGDRLYSRRCKWQCKLHHRWRYYEISQLTTLHSFTKLHTSAGNKTCVTIIGDVKWCLSDMFCRHSS